MITIITGGNGSGKTAYVVWQEIKKANEEGRVVYCHGIPKLKLPTVQMTKEQVLRWHETDPDKPVDPNDGVGDLLNIQPGSLMIIDEVQDIWPPAGTGAKVPPELAMLAKHRRYGMDIIVLSPYPKLIHAHLRFLAGRHIHFRETGLGRKLYEFPEWVENPAMRSNRQNASVRSYKVPSAVFDLYESSNAHTVTKKRKPTAFYFGIGMVLLLPVFLYYGYTNTQKMLHPPVVSLISAADAASLSPGHKPVTLQASSPVKVFQDVAMVSPQYDWSKIGACVQMHGHCSCYGNHGDKLALPESVCVAGVVNGWPGRDAPPLAAATDPIDNALPTTRHEEKVKPPVESIHVDQLSTTNADQSKSTGRFN